MTDTETGTPVALRRADPERIETELMKIWNEVTAELGTDVVLRARSLTLVAFTDTPSREPEIQETLSQVSRRHPCRSILICKCAPGQKNGQPAEAADLETAVAVDCYGGGRTRVCNEQILIHAGDAVLEQVTSLVLALVVPDLPIAVWWWGDVPREGAIFRALYDLSDRFLLDATTFEDPIHSLSLEANQLLTTRGFPILADLAWEELADWRDLIAQFFDVAEWRSHLGAISDVRLFYDWHPDTPHNPAEAIFVAGWIGSQLDWQPETASRTAEGDCTLIFQAGDHRVRVEIVPTATPRGFEKGVAMMEMRTADVPPLIFHLSRDDDDVCGTMRVIQRDETLYHRTVSLRMPNRIDALDRFLTHLGRDRLFGSTLRTLVPLLHKLAG